jgi:predicted Zn-dependent protease
LETAERALAALPAGAEAQATVTAERSLLLRFADSRPTQATAVDDLAVEVTALHEGQIGGAVTNATDDESLRACASAALAAAEAAARRPAGAPRPGLPAPAPARVHAGWDEATAALDAARGGTALGTAFDAAAARGAQAHGVWTAGEVRTAVASTAGVAAVDRVTDAFMKVVAVAPSGRSGYAADTTVASGALDAAAVAARAADKAVAGGDELMLEPGTHPVVFERHAVAELLSFLGSLALNGLAYAEDRSALCGRLGARVAAARVNIADSPRHPATLPRAFDAEGVPKAPLPMIQDGVARAVAHDTRSAALCDAASTGHALAPGGAPDGPVPTNLVMAGGGARDETDLCRGIERGIYVTRLWYVNPVRPRETLVTGVTRDGTFLVEDGQITHPLADMRVTDSVLDVLARVEELTAGAELTGTSEFYGRRFATGVVAPALRAGAVRFTA